MQEEIAKKFHYWIKERDLVRQKKEASLPKPWSDDPVFQTTYFCNVRREHDRVTKWIRNFYNPYVGRTLFEYNIILSRFVNKTETLNLLGYQEQHDQERIKEVMSRPGTWGNAYVITTHGIPMPKAVYLAENVLGAVYKGIEELRTACWGPSLAAAAAALQEIEGIGPFLAGQIVADLKNTPKHPLAGAEDWWDFVIHGPGSLRGASWLFHGSPMGVNERDFQVHFRLIRQYVDTLSDLGPRFCNQDLQNCLCEFDKYMRVSTGTGRSKRKYPGER